MPKSVRPPVEALEVRRLLAAAVPLLPPVGTQWRSLTDPVSFAGDVWFKGQVSTSNGIVGGLYRTDGTQAGTKLTADTLPVLQNATFDPYQGGVPRVVNDRMLVPTAAVNSRDVLLYSTDGTAGGTTLLTTKLIRVLDFPGAPAGKIYYTALRSDGKPALWSTDGTVAGTRDFAKPPGGEFDVIGFKDDWAYYTTGNADAGYALSRTDGTVTEAVATVAAGTPGDLQHFRGDRAIFVVTDAANARDNRRLWETDGTAEGTHPLDTTINVLGEPAQLNGIAYFFGSLPNGQTGVYRTNGTLAGTYKIADSAVTTSYTNQAAESAVFGGRLYLSPHDNGTSDNVLAIDADGTVTRLDAKLYTKGFTAEGDRLWLGGTSAYVTAAAPTDVVLTDGGGPAVGTADGHYVYPYNDVAGNLSLRAWDSRTATTPTADIGGYVYNDLDGDGVYNGSVDTPFKTGSVYLDLNANGRFDAGDPSVAIGDDARYALSAVPAGTWDVRVVEVPGVTLAASTARVTVRPGESSPNNRLLASSKTRLRGVVFNDANANGTQDANETGVYGVKVVLDPSPTATPNAADPYVYTDTTGHYLFNDLASFAGYVRVVPPAGTYRQSTAAVATNVPASYVGVVSGPALGLVPPGNARVDFAIDINGDNAITAADPASFLLTVPVYADLNENGVQDAAEPGVLAGDESVLANLPAGRVVLRVVPPQGWRTSLGSNSAEVMVQAGTTVRVPQFLLSPLTGASAVLSGVVAEDSDFSGSVTAGDAGAPLVSLWDDADGDGTRDFGEAYTLTNAGGAFAFTALPAGAHAVRMTVTSAYVTASGVYAFDAATGATLNVSVFAPARAARLGGQVRLDANNNGTLDATDPPMKGVYVAPTSFWGSGSSLPPVTNADGRFSIPVAAGNYTPTVLYLSGYTTVNAVTGVTLKTGQTKDDYTILLKGPAAPTVGSVSGTVFRDENANGVRDPGELPFAGATVYADLNLNGSIAFGTEPSVSAAADGSYRFDGITGASVAVLFAPGTTAYRVTNGNVAYGRSVAVGGANVTNVDLAVAPVANVVGYVYADFNKNGTRDTLDGGRAGVRVWADLNANNVYDAADWYAFTASNGAYTLTVPQNRAVTVRVDLPTNATATSATVATVTSGVAGTNSILDFGFTDARAQIAGRAYYDLNHNGAYDSGETFGAGTVTLYNAATNALVGTTTISTADNYFRFGNLAAATYRVAYAVGNDFVGKENATGAIVTVAAGESSAGTLFGYDYPTAAYTGRVMRDYGATGSDAADVPISGVRAFLDDNNNYLYDPGEYSALTDATGTFNITGVQYKTDGSNYWRYLVVENPSGMLLTSPYMGNNRSRFFGTVGPNDAGTYTYAPPTPVSYGAEITGHLYQDLNTNGRRDADEPGLPYGLVGTDFGFLPGFDAILADREGFYSYHAENAGTVYLRSKADKQWIPTDPLFGGSKPVTYTQGQIVSGPDFGYVDFQIGGRLFADANRNGQYDTGEAPVAGRRVWIDTNGNDAYDSGERATVTDAGGYFKFADTGGGTFRVAQDKPAGERGKQAVDVVVKTGGATGGVTFAVAKPPAAAATFVVDDGTKQRSAVRSVDVTLNAVIDAGGIAAGAFTLVRDNDPAQSFGVTVKAIAPLDGGKTRVTLAFGGPGVANGTLGDGRYTLTVNGNRLTDADGYKVDAAGTGTAGSSIGTKFFRLYADTDGNAVVDFSDFLILQSKYMSVAGDDHFSAWLDANGDNAINFSDFLQLQSRYLQPLA